MTEKMIKLLTLIFVLTTLGFAFAHKYQRIQNYPKELAKYQTRVFHCDFEVKHIFRIKDKNWCREPYNNSCYSIRFLEGFEYVTKENVFTENEKIFVTSFNKCKVIGDTATTPELANSPEATRFDDPTKFLIRDYEWIVPLTELKTQGPKPTF